MHATLLQVLDDFEQMADRAGQAVEADDDEYIAGAKIFEQLRQYRPCP